MPRFVLESGVKEGQLEAAKLDSISEDAFITLLPLRSRRNSSDTGARGIHKEQDPEVGIWWWGPGSYTAMGRAGEEAVEVSAPVSRVDKGSCPVSMVVAVITWYWHNRILNSNDSKAMLLQTCHRQVVSGHTQ